MTQENTPPSPRKISLRTLEAVLGIFLTILIIVMMSPLGTKWQIRAAAKEEKRQNNIRLFGVPDVD